MRSTRTTLLLGILAGGCGGGTVSTLAPNSPATPTSRVTSVVPTCAAPLASGASEPCSAAVAGNGTFNKTVNWSASGGTISSAGMLTAPSVTSISSIVVTATSVQDSVIGTATVSVTPPSTSPPPVGTVTLSNTNLDFGTVVIGNTLQQTVTITNTGPGVVTIASVSPFGEDYSYPSVANQCVSSVTLAANASCVITIVFMPTLAQVRPGHVNFGFSNSTNSLAQISMAGAGAHPPPPAVTGPVNLGAGFGPSTVIDSNGAIDIAWQTDTGINFRRSVDGGATFSSAQLVIPQAVTGDFVEMKLDSSNDISIFSSYQGANDPMPIPQLARSTDGVNFVLHPVPTAAVQPEMAVEPSGAIDFAWFANKTLYAIRSTDGGVTFSSPKTIYSTPDDVLDVDATVGPQGQLYLFFGHESGRTCDILFSGSLDGSQTFSLPKSISGNSPSCNSGAVPNVDAAGNLNATWDDSNSIVFAHSTDQGQTFSLATVATGPFAIGDAQFVVGPSGEIDLVFDSQGANLYDSFFTQSKDHGATFSTPVKLNQLPDTHPAGAIFTGAVGPVVGVDGAGKITVAWDDDATSNSSGWDEIYTSTSTNGLTFTDAVNLTNTPNEPEAVSQILVNAKGARYFVWGDSFSSAFLNVNIFFDAVP